MSNVTIPLPCYCRGKSETHLHINVTKNRTEDIFCKKTSNTASLFYLKFSRTAVIMKKKAKKHHFFLALDFFISSNSARVPGKSVILPLSISMIRVARLLINSRS